jgi:Stress responsive A/B Barrel Domain
MKTLTLCLLSALGLALSAFAADAAPKEKLRHVVAFKFKETTTKEQIRQVEEAFHALKAKIPQVVSVEWGTNISPEKLDKGFTHAFIVTFKTEKDRDAYLVHPEHKKFVEFALPLIGDAFVIDFWGKN